MIFEEKRNKKLGPIVVGRDGVDVHLFGGGYGVQNEGVVLD